MVEVEVEVEVEVVEVEVGEGEGGGGVGSGFRVQRRWDDVTSLPRVSFKHERRRKTSSGEY